MISNDAELDVTLQRIARFEAQVVHLRNLEASSANYHSAASGFLREIDRMQFEIREYLSKHPPEQNAAR
jgi:hypothetical protein